MHPMTKDNLRSAFSGESQAHMKYLMAVRVKDGKVNVYWNGKELIGGPFFVER